MEGGDGGAGLVEKLLQNPSVHTRNGVNTLLQVVKDMQQQGKEKLMVVTDFDMTLSRYFANGSRGLTSFAVIETSSLMPAAYREEVAALKRKFAPLEVDPTLSKEERKKYMDEWYSKAHTLLVESKVKKSDLKEIVQSGNIRLRDGCDNLFSLLHSNHIPLVILSAGIADTLVLAIEQQSSMRDNISVISNNFLFDDDGVATGFSKTMITSSNKGNLQDQFAALSDKLQGRGNVILLGDSLCDPQMVDGMETRPQNLIKIGFLNHDVDRLLPTYLDLYDVVLTGDGDMTVINTLLGVILKT